MLQQEKPEDFVIATGETHSVREFVVEAFAHIGITIKYDLHIEPHKKSLMPLLYRWTGMHEQEIGTGEEGKVYVRIDPKFYRPTDVALTVGKKT